MKKILFFILLFPLPLCASINSVAINEIAWMGTASSSNHEWIELVNLSDSKVDLSGWTLAAEDGVPAIELNGVVSAKGYFLLSREESDLPDQIFSGALNNQGEHLILENQNGDLIDEVLSLEKWMAGDNQLKLTMERTISMQTWKNSVGPGGTPRAKNSLELDELDGEVDILPKVKEKIEENELNQETAPVYTPTELVDIGRRSIGDLVSVQGSAVVLPGVLGTQYFYVCDSLGVCLQIYSYTKDFPELEIGQEMAVTGELSQTKGEWRLKTKTKDDIFVLSDGIFMEPVAWNSQISVSRLVKVSGKIVDINGDHLFLANEQAEVEVFDKNKMVQNYFVGDEVELVGITALSGEKSVVLLLSVEKISLINEVNFTATSSSNAIDKKDNTVQASSSTFSWLTVFPWLFNLLLFGYLFKKKP